MPTDQNNMSIPLRSLTDFVTQRDILNAYNKERYIGLNPPCNNTDDLYWFWLPSGSQKVYTKPHFKNFNKESDKFITIPTPSRAHGMFDIFDDRFWDSIDCE